MNNLSLISFEMRQHRQFSKNLKKQPKLYKKSVLNCLSFSRHKPMQPVQVFQTNEHLLNMSTRPQQVVLPGLTGPLKERGGCFFHRPANARNEHGSFSFDLLRESQTRPLKRLLHSKYSSFGYFLMCPEFHKELGKILVKWV